MSMSSDNLKNAIVAALEITDDAGKEAWAKVAEAIINEVKNATVTVANSATTGAAGPYTFVGAGNNTSGVLS